MIVYFEGIDGMGKSTQIERLKERFAGAISTHEPGGSDLGKRLREILLGGNLSTKAEILLFLADRAEHCAKVFEPNKNKLILSDRGFVSGLAYAMANNENLDISELIWLNKFALNNDFGGKFVFFKADEKLLKDRLLKRASKDSIEERGIAYLMRVQEYMEIILKDLELDTLEIYAGDEIESITARIETFIKG